MSRELLHVRAEEAPGADARLIVGYKDTPPRVIDIIKPRQSNKRVAELPFLGRAVNRDQDDAVPLPYKY